jgi:fucose permease
LEKLKKNSSIDFRDFRVCFGEKKTIMKLVLCSYALSMVCLGITTGIFGPLIPSLADTVNVATSTFSWVMIARGIAAVMCTALASQAIAKFGGSVAQHFTICMLAASLVMMAWTVPWLRSFAFTIVWLSALAGGGGHLDALVNSLVVRLFDERDSDDARRMNVAMQLVHFAFGVGAVVSPLLVRGAAALPGADAASIVQWSLIFSALVVAVAGLPWIVIVPAAEPNNAQQRRDAIELLTIAQDDDGDGEDDDIEPFSQASRKRGGEGGGGGGDYMMLALSGAVLLFDVGLELGYGNWITTLAIAKGVDAEYAILLSSIFWIAMTAGRGASIFVSMWLSRQQMLAIDMLLCIAASVWLLFIGDDSPSLELTAVTILFGVGICSVFPIVVMLPEALEISTPHTTTVLVTLASAGESFIPPLLGLLSKFSSHAIPYTFLALLALSIALLLILAFLYRRRHQ